MSKIKQTGFCKSLVYAAGITTLAVGALCVLAAAKALLGIQLMPMGGVIVILWVMLLSSLWFGISRTLIQLNKHTVNLELSGSILASAACAWFAGVMLTNPSFEYIYWQLLMLTVGTLLIGTRFYYDSTPRRTPAGA